jgi:hypothetical protein
MLPTEPPRPTFAALICLDRRLARLSLSSDPEDERLLATGLGYIADLTRELERVRPVPRERLPWDHD